MKYYYYVFVLLFKFVISRWDVTGGMVQHGIWMGIWFQMWTRGSNAWLLLLDCMNVSSMSQCIIPWSF